MKYVFALPFAALAMLTATQSVAESAKFTAVRRSQPESAHREV